MASTGIIARSIRTKLSSLNPVFLDVINESYKHNVPKGSESHFKVIVVSEEFEGLPLIKRHRTVNHMLADELAMGVHALSIVAKTPTQWEENMTVSPSPNCLGGSAAEKKNTANEGKEEAHDDKVT
ncbi:BOLA1 [Symbiodinium microadriaticum]|nr:BOLA1 [Symbiodinium microadriaticum]